MRADDEDLIGPARARHLGVDVSHGLAALEVVRLAAGGELQILEHALDIRGGELEVVRVRDDVALADHAGEHVHVPAESL
jgi:hypothetical protein